MKKLITNYTFDASEKTITFADFTTIELNRVQLVTNETDGIIIFNFADTGLTGTVATNVLTLAYDTTSMDDADRLQIFYDVPSRAPRDTLTMTLASLANGSARQSTLKTKPELYDFVDIFLKITSGSAPTSGTVYEVYLITSDGTVADDNAGASDAAITIENSVLIGTIIVTGTLNKAFFGVIKDVSLRGATSWGIAVLNRSGQALNSTEDNHIKGFVYHD